MVAKQKILIVDDDNNIAAVSYTHLSYPQFGLSPHHFFETSSFPSLFLCSAAICLWVSLQQDAPSLILCRYTSI